MEFSEKNYRVITFGDEKYENILSKLLEEKHYDHLERKKSNDPSILRNSFRSLFNYLKEEDQYSLVLMNNENYTNFKRKYCLRVHEDIFYRVIPIDLLEEHEVHEERKKNLESFILSRLNNKIFRMIA